MIPAEAKAVMQGASPSLVTTCSADGVPNASVISQVYYVDENHVALSYQFFNKTARNVAENPQATIMGLDPHTFGAWFIEAVFDHAEEDVRQRMVREARVDAETILHVTRAQLVKHVARLVPGERERIEAAVAALVRAAAADDPVAIRDAYDALSQTSEPFARRIMDEALQEAVGGRALEEL